MKKNIVFATLILLALSLSGCKMAEINPRAICLYFNFLVLAIEIKVQNGV